MGFPVGHDRPRSTAIKHQTANGIQEVVGSIPIGSTRLRSKPRFELRPGKPGRCQRSFGRSLSRRSPRGEVGPGKPVHAIYGDHRMATFHYVYILVSTSYPERHYTGRTTDLQKRLTAHNRGQLPYTSKYKPWFIDAAIAFRSKTKAIAFEQYLKSHSGRAFATKHF